MFYQFIKTFILIIKKLNDLSFNYKFDVYNIFIKKIEAININPFSFYIYYKIKIIITFYFNLINIYIDLKATCSYINKKFF